MWNRAIVSCVLGISAWAAPWATAQTPPPDQAGSAGFWFSGNPPPRPVQLKVIQFPFPAAPPRSLFISPDGSHSVRLDVSPTSGTSLVIDDNPVANYPAASVSGVAFSKDGRHVGVALYTHGKTVLYLDGKFLELGDYLAPKFLQWTADGKLLCMGYSAAWRSCFVLIDGKAQKQYGNYNATTGLLVSADGDHYGFMADELDGWTDVVIDGRDQPAPAGSSLMLSDQGGHFICVIRPTLTKYAALIDGVAGPPYEAIEGPAISPDGRHTAYFAYPSEGERVLVMNGNTTIEPVQSYWRPHWHTIVFSREGGHFAYMGDRGTTYTVVWDGKDGKRYRQILDHPVLSPDGHHIGYHALDGGQTFLVLDDREIPADRADAGAPIVFSPDSRHVAYVLKRLVFLDGRQGLAAGYGMTFTPDSRHLVYFTLKGEMIVDNQQTDDPGNLQADRNSPLTFTDDHTVNLICHADIDGRDHMNRQTLTIDEAPSDPSKP